MSQANGDSKHSHRSSAEMEKADQPQGEGVEKKKKLSILQRFSEKLMNFLEGGFSRLGYLIGSRPIVVMLVALVVSALLSLGMIGLEEETAPDKLWVPDGSNVIDNLYWISKNFPSAVRREYIMATDTNVLDATSIKALFHLYNESINTKSSDGDTYQDICLSSPNCIVYGVLELWKYDGSVINGLTDNRIIADINSAVNSPMYNQPLEWSKYLGGITRDNTGKIVSAKAAFMIWMTDGSDEMLSRTESWENKFVDIGLEGHPVLGHTYVTAGRSFDDESGSAMGADVSLLFIGFILVLLFVFSVLGKFNFMEQKMWLTAAGFVCIALSILIATGLGSSFQQVYGPLQSLLPFLLLGIGVDDMFVIISALDNLTPEEKDCDVPELMAKVLGHAGVAITVTSLTDFVAFMVGSCTIIPGLRSFCVYAAIGILALYALQVTFFTACVAFDVSRIRANRDACCFCYTHPEDYEPNKCSQKQFVTKAFEKGLAPAITNTPVRIAIIVVTLVLFAVNVWGFVELKQFFDPNWFLPDDSYAAKFLDVQNEYFPSSGNPGYMYCGKMDYFGSKHKLQKLNTLMQKSEYISNGTVDSWFGELTNWLHTTTDPNVTPLLDPNTHYPTTQEAFRNLTHKMTTDTVPRTKSYINFEANGVLRASCIPFEHVDLENAEAETEPLEEDTFDLATRIPFEHVDLDSAEAEIQALEDTFDLVTKAGFKSGDCFPNTIRYRSWETNKVIKEELYRSLALGMLCVFLVGLLLIANIGTTILVFLAVIFTLVDVAGTMHFWGLTIEMVTSIILILSIGLAVDYSAHIGHMFMRVPGNRVGRVKRTITAIGRPIFFGGVGTLLAFILLVGSNSYVFRTFFKVNFLVVIYGMFHGLIFLPVVLSFIGPDAYPNVSAKGHNTKKSNEVDKANHDPDGLDNRGFQCERNEPKGVEMTGVHHSPTPENLQIHTQQPTTIQYGSSSDNIDMPHSSGDMDDHRDTPYYPDPDISQRRDSFPITVVRL